MRLYSAAGGLHRASQVRGGVIKMSRRGASLCVFIPFPPRALQNKRGRERGERGQRQRGEEQGRGEGASLSRRRILCWEEAQPLRIAQRPKATIDWPQA